MRVSPTFPAAANGLGPKAAVWVRHFMSATMTIQPAISFASLPSRRQLEVVEAICALTPSRPASLATLCAPPRETSPDLLPITHQNDHHARLAWLQADATTTRSYPTQSRAQQRRRDPRAPSFNLQLHEVRSRSPRNFAPRILYRSL